VARDPGNHKREIEQARDAWQVRLISLVLRPIRSGWWTTPVERASTFEQPKVRYTRDPGSASSSCFADP